MLDLLKKYVEARIELVKMELITITANLAAVFVSSFIMLIFSLFILLMLSFSMAYWLSEVLNNFAIGFAIVGGFYTLLFLIYLVMARKKIELKIKNEVVSSALDAEEEVNQDL